MSRFLLRDEDKRDRIDAVAGIGPGEAFAREHMAQVATARHTGDLYAMSVCIRRPLYSALDLLVKAWPTTGMSLASDIPVVGIELAFRAVERGAALAADIDATFRVVFILAGKRTLGAFSLDDTGFFGCQGRHVIWGRHGILTLRAEVTSV